MQGTPVTTSTEIVWPITLALAILFIVVFFKLLLESERTKPSSPTRANAMFSAFFLAPDMIALALGLLVSSQAIKRVLDTKNLATHYGNDFSNYFFALLLFFIGAFVLVAVMWHRSDGRFRNFPVAQRDELVYGNDGKQQTITVYDVQVFSGIFVSRVGRANLLYGNLLGIACLMAYVLFIYYGFITPPPWR